MRSLIQRVRRVQSRLSMSPAARAVVRDRLTYLSPMKLNRLERSARDVLRAGVAGDVLEFGIALGGSTILLGKQAAAAGRPFHGFDVFGMIPPPTSEKDDEKARKRYEVIASGASQGIGGDVYYGYRQDLYSDVCRAMAKHGLPVDGRSITLHKGLFEETVPVAPIQSIAFAHVDCDWYDPVRYCLNAVADRLSPGGVIVLDDYHDYPSCKTATDEFLAARRDFVVEDGENVILRRAR